MEETEGQNLRRSLENADNSDRDSQNDRNLRNALEESLKSVNAAIQHMPLDSEMQEV
jgi:hypothetical protein